MINDQILEVLLNYFNFNILINQIGQVGITVFSRLDVIQSLEGGSM